MSSIESVPRTSADITADRVVALKDLIPEAFTEGKIDFSKLHESLGDIVDDSPERYSFTWAGKRDALRALQAPTSATLVPCQEESVNWDTTQHLFIEGDNLEVLKLLYKSYFGKVKLIYIDPPYNTGKDFIYPDNYADTLDPYMQITGQRDEDDNDLSNKKETSGRHHSRWLTMMYPRLFLSRQLLRRDGTLFVSIDDKELQNLLRLCDEIFGEENRIGIICWKNVTDNNPTLITPDNEFIVCYAHSKEAQPKEWKSQFSAAKDLLRSEYERLRNEGLSTPELQAKFREFISDNQESVGSLSRYKHVDKVDVYTGSESVHNPRPGGYDFEIIHPETRGAMRKPANGYRFPETTFREMEKNGAILYGEDENRIVKIKKYLADYEDSLRSVITLDGRLGSYELKRLFPGENSVFSNPKPSELLESLISFTTDTGGIVLDFFAGSGSMGHAVLGLNRKDKGNRKFVLVQLPEPTGRTDYLSIAEITKERIRRVIQQFGADTENPRLDDRSHDQGFRVFKLAPSHFRDWTGISNSTPEEYLAQMDAYADPLFAGVDDIDIAWEVAIKEGFSLTSQVERSIVQDHVVYRITDSDSNRFFHICLDSGVNANIPAALHLSNDDLFVCRDLALDDTTAANLALQCRLKTI
jgi:adenine-specific DNA-methyltransferase